LRFNTTSFVRLSAIVFVALFFHSVRSASADPTTPNLIYTTDVQHAENASANGDYETSFNDYALAIAADPTQPSAQTAALNILEQNTPHSINLTSIQNLPTSGLPFDVAIENTEAGAVNTDYKTVIIVPHGPLTPELDDPVENWPFGRSAYVYSTRGESNALLLCTMHYQSPDYSTLGARIGSLLALLDVVYAQKMDISRADDSLPFHVWLCSTAPVSSGGEQWRNNIYFYDVGDERSSIEWIREIAHEFSHLAFPAVGGSYTEPEAFANGYLGERLLVRWLDEGAAGGAPSVEATWKGTFAGYPNFDRLLIAPSLAEFKKHALNKDSLSQLDAEGMRYLIGMMLRVDDVCGSAEVGAILQGLADKHSTDPNDLYDSVKAALDSAGKSK